MVDAATAAAPVAGANAATQKVSYGEVQKVLEQRCYMCHGAAGPDESAAAAGCARSEVALHAQGVYQQAVVSKLMPMNNSTGITDAERALLGKWFARWPASPPDDPSA